MPRVRSPPLRNLRLRSTRKKSRSSWNSIKSFEVNRLSLLSPSSPVLAVVRNAFSIERTIEMSGTTSRHSTVDRQRDSRILSTSCRCRARLREESRQSSQTNRSETSNTEGATGDVGLSIDLETVGHHRPRHSNTREVSQHSL